MGQNWHNITETKKTMENTWVDFRFLLISERTNLNFNGLYCEQVYKTKNCKIKTEFHFSVQNVFYRPCTGAIM